MSRAASKQAKKGAQTAQQKAAGAIQKRATAADTIRSLQSRAGNRATTYALSSGTPLPPGLRASMEQKLNFDFSNVRIHTDNRAAATAESMDAKAYTLGSDIVFNRGEFSPQGDTGKKLLTHELAHVVQQSRGGPQLDSTHSVSMEHSAERAASAAGTTSAINVQGGSAVGVARAPKNKNPLNMPKETVDMPWEGRRRVVQGGRERNLTSELGFKRSGPWFWRRWRDAHRGTGALSPDNIKKINKGRAPVVDDAWIKQYPEHAPYKGQTLHHHHAGHGGTASPLPESLHKAAKDKVFHAEKQNVSDLKPGDKLPPKADPKVRRRAVSEATKAGEIPKTKGGRTQKMPKVSPGSEVAALPKSQQGRAKSDTHNVDPDTGIVKKGGGKKAKGKGAGVGSAATKGKGAKGTPGKSANAPKKSKGNVPKGSTGPKKTPSKTTSPKGPQTKPNKGPAPSKGPTPEHAPPHTAKPGPAPHTPSLQAPAGQPHVEPHAPTGEPKVAPHTTTAEPHVTPPSAPHPAPAAKPSPPPPELKVEAPAKPAHMAPPKPAPAPTLAPEVHTPGVHGPNVHAPNVHAPNVHAPGGGGKLGKALKVAGPGIAVGLGAYNTYKDIKDGQKPGEAIAGNVGQTAVNLTSIGGPADMAINLANLGLQHTNAPEEVKEGGNLLADVTPSTFGGNAAKQFLRAGYNIATGDDKALDKQVDDMNRGKGGTPLQGYSLWFTKVIPELASGKDAYKTFDEASKMINNKTLEKAGNFLGDETYQFVNKDLPEAYEFAKKDFADAKKAASEKWESTKEGTKSALKSAWNYFTRD